MHTTIKTTCKQWADTVVGSKKTQSADLLEDTESATFISTVLKTAIECFVCNGYLDPQNLPSKITSTRNAKVS